MSTATPVRSSRPSRSVLYFRYPYGLSYSARPLVGGFLANIFWDTNLFIYLLEDSAKFAEPVENLRRRMLRRNDHLLTSAMTVGEVLVKPLSSGNALLIDRYRKFFSAPHLTVSSFDLGAAEAYGRIRQDRTIGPADAIQLACAASAAVDLFITNDDRLSQKNIEGIQFITSLSRAPI